PIVAHAARPRARLALRAHAVRARAAAACPGRAVAARGRSPPSPPAHRPSIGRGARIRARARARPLLSRRGAQSTGGGARVLQRARVRTGTRAPEPRQADDVSDQTRLDVSLRVLMVTGAYYPELAGGSLQCRT